MSHGLIHRLSALPERVRSSAVECVSPRRAAAPAAHPLISVSGLLIAADSVPSLSPAPGWPER
jgi:hypothetical protein